MLRGRIDGLAAGARVLDIGCLGWKLKKHRPDLAHAGCDMTTVSTVPDGVDYRICDVDKERLPWDDDSFDLVVASHVLEHLRTPIEAFGEVVRVCKPGGAIYVETPSERSLVPTPFNRSMHGFFSHWDDPTHLRPWSPRALYRLILGYGCQPLACDYIVSPWSRLTFPLSVAHYLLTRDGDRLTDEWWKTIGFAAYGLGRKPRSLHGGPPFEYRSLKGIPEAAIQERFRSDGSDDGDTP
jgi:SAM-dependent methyltransferase